MKVAMFTDYFHPELGGIQDSLATLSRSLGMRGFQVRIYAPRYAPRDYERVGIPLGDPDLGANVLVRRRPSVSFPSSTRQSRAAVISPIGWVRLTGRERPDLIHVHSFFGIGLEALVNGAVLRIPVIGTNHTTIAGFAPHIPLRVERASTYVAWFYNRCDHVTAPSRALAEELAAAGLVRPSSVISNPIDTALFRPPEAGENAASRAEFGLPGPVITYAGRLGPEKNIDVLLFALAALRDRGIVAGLAIAGHGSHEPILRSLVADLRLGQQVTFLGTLSQGSLARLLRVSDLFAIMSTSETQSMVTLQAMACGLPVVAANSRALPEFVRPDRGVLVEPHDAGQLAIVLADLLASPERRRRLGATGHMAAQQYGVETVTDGWETLYRSVLHRKEAA